MRLSIKVVPKSSRDRIAGWMGKTLKVCITAPPEKGKSNSAVQSLLGEILGCSTEAIRVVTGKRSHLKIIEIEKKSPEEILQRLNVCIRENERKEGTGN